jgi:hypothetical protein
MEYPARCFIVLAAFTALLRMPVLGRDKAEWFNLQSLHPDQKITVTQTNGENIEGRFRELSERSITLQIPTSQISIQRTDVQRVTVGSGLTRLRNSAIGMGVGAGIGAVVATKTAARDHSFAALGAGLFSFGVGGVCGAVMPARKTIYEVRSTRSGAAPHDTPH